MASVIQVLRDTLPGRELRAASISSNVSPGRRKLMRSKLRPAEAFVESIMAPYWRQFGALSSVLPLRSFYCFCQFLLDVSETIEVAHPRIRRADLSRP